MDRYQDEIRRAAAKSVKDLNLAPESRSRGISPPVVFNNVTAAAAKIEHLQRLNQINSLGRHANGGSAGVRRNSLDHQQATVANGLKLGKSNSASSIISNGSHQHGVIAKFALGTAADQELVARFGQGLTLNEDLQQFQPGTYPQAKRSSLTSIPIYENLDGYPAEVGHEPPPYTGSHNIVGMDVLSKRNSRSSIESFESKITGNGSPSSSLSKNYPTRAELVSSSYSAHQQPLIKPPILPPKAGMASGTALAAGANPTAAAAAAAAAASAGILRQPPNYENMHDQQNGQSIVAQLANQYQTTINRVPSTGPALAALSREDQSNMLFRDYVNLPPPPPYPGIQPSHHHGQSTSSATGGSHGECTAVKHRYRHS